MTDTILTRAVLAILLSCALSGTLLAQSEEPVNPEMPTQTNPIPEIPISEIPATEIPTSTDPTSTDPTSTDPTSTSTIDPNKPFYGESSPSVSVVRDDKTITAIKYGPDDQGLAIICPPKDSDPDQLTQTVYADIAPFFVHITVDKNLIRAPIAFVEAKEGGDGKIEAYAGTASESKDPNACLPDIQPDPKPGTVFVEQGKTRLSGSKLEYDRATGIAEVAGPIVFERPQQNDTLKGTSDSIRIFVDAQKTVLTGNVQLTSNCRVSNADRVEYDDTKNRAVLFGKPAISKQLNGKGEIQGAIIEYNLETNDVIVTESFGGVNGQFDDTATPCK